MLVPFNLDFRIAFENVHKNFMAPILNVSFSDSNELENAMSNIFSPYAFLLSSELRKPDRDINVVLKCIERMRELTNLSGIIDDDLLITPVDSRGDILTLFNTGYEEKILFDRHSNYLKSILPKTWINLVSIIKTVTIVSVTGKEELLENFSGSDTDRWGAMHMGNNLTLMNIAECITHEASHHWLNLYEFNCECEFIIEGWSNINFISPWRRDLRPLMGIFHGVYVFSNVFAVLQFLSIRAGESYERVNYIGAQVSRGIEIIQEHKSKLSPLALKLFEDVKIVFNEVYLRSDLSIRNFYYEGVLHEEKNKKKSFR
jgi:hypothetical protein